MRAFVLSLLLSATLCLAAPPTFTKTSIDHAFRSEGCAAADVNHDGRLDLLCGDVWYEAPDWHVRALRQPGRYDPKTGYSNAFLVYTVDANADGWADELVVDYPAKAAHWYENPQNKPGLWREHPALPRIGNENPWFCDLLGDGRPGLLCGDTDKHQLVFGQPGKDGTVDWPSITLSRAGEPGAEQYSHGIGAGDVNGDGRRDVVVRQGWWEQPANGHTPWAFHPADLGPDCATMQVYDVNADGRPDVLSSAAHQRGVWWYEQLPDGSFRQHVIDDRISQTHCLQMVDVNGDGLPDLVTGKRFFAHNGGDPGANEPAMLVWYELTRAGGEVKYVRHDVDSDGGIGLSFVAQDLNGDGKVDFAVSNKKGVAVYLQN